MSDDLSIQSYNEFVFVVPTAATLQMLSGKRSAPNDHYRVVHCVGEQIEKDVAALGDDLASILAMSEPLPHLSSGVYRWFGMAYKRVGADWEDVVRYVGSIEKVSNLEFEKDSTLRAQDYRLDYV